MTKLRINDGNMPITYMDLKVKHKKLTNFYVLQSLEKREHAPGMRRKPEVWTLDQKRTLDH
jgi:hypothetical protein